MIKSIHYIFLGFFCAPFFSFGQESMSFEILSAERTGINFINKLTEKDTFNYLSFQYMYNGGGVALGDINNDGLCDIYFTGNQVSDKLYLNKGNMKFEDITKKAIGEKADEGWHTGVTMVDVNGDKYLDIFVCRSGLDSFGALRTNLLYINQKNGTFKELSKEFGLTSSRASTQAAFFDMDKDGDLDLYVMNRPSPPAERGDVDLMKYPYSDQLYENQNGIFVDISDKSGIQNYGFGLGVAISDFNNDGWPDIYVSNDYIGQDYMYINNKNKTFSEQIKGRTRHVSYNGMGNDVSDFNNDGYVDIMTVDMAIEDHVKSKTSMAGMNPVDFWNSVDYGNQYEYMFNSLQLNNGNGTFSDVALALGVAKTDWSWGPLFADFDNDGFKDLVITNGFRREIRDNDFLKRLESMTYSNSDFEEILGLAAETVVPNYFFRNINGKGFEHVSSKWKMDMPINSNGAAYGDLDNDGDLDLVVNNMETVSSIFENKLSSSNHYLKVKFDENFVGAKIRIFVGDQIFYQEANSTRGYQSCVDNVVHFGLGPVQKIDEIEVEFQDGKFLYKNNVSVDQTLNLSYNDASDIRIARAIAAPLFTKEQVVEYMHSEYIINDFKREILLPHKMSQLGPFISKGDINGDHLDDFYLSGSRFYPGAMFVQQADGSFKLKNGPWERQREREDMASLFFDADNDGDLDLYIVSGTNEYILNTTNSDEIAYNQNLQDQLYINDGTGEFENKTHALLPEMLIAGQRVVAGDYDNDGDLDLFIGGRQVPGYYPYSPPSYLLRNDGGKFHHEVRSKDLEYPGMITQSIFEDIDRDGDLDLICVGEWMPITIFENTNGIFKNVTEKYGLTETVGWWMSIAAGDFNGDGINDYVIGNIGENNKFHPSKENPLEIYTSDFDENGSLDIVLGKYQQGTCYPVRGRECSSQQMPFITQKFPTYNEFAHADLAAIYGGTKLDSALHFSATEFSSCILLSNPNGYELQHLPYEAQFGPLNALLIEDFNLDGFLDILGVGNNFGAEIETVRYDAGRGVLLLGDGKGKFKGLSPQESGFFVNSDAKDMMFLDDYIVVSSNADSLKFFRWK